jgi:hypothetical protein
LDGDRLFVGVIIGFFVGIFEGFLVGFIEILPHLLPDVNITDMTEPDPACVRIGFTE